MDNYVDDLFLILRQSGSNTNNTSLVSAKTVRRKGLKAAWASQKAKNLDDPIIIMEARISALQDQWLIQQNKVMPALKAYLKKAEKAEKKKRLD